MRTKRDVLKYIKMGMETEFEIKVVEDKEWL